MKKFCSIKFFLVFFFCIQVLLSHSVLIAEEIEDRVVINSQTTYTDVNCHDVNVSSNGAVFCVETNGELEISQATFTNNISTGDYGGGAIFNEGITRIINGIIFSSNTAIYGGAIYNNTATMKISKGDIFFSSNKAINGSGGAIFNSNSTVTINGNNITFNYNIATSSGGTIYNYDSVATITGKNIEFFSNSATNGSGGVIFSTGTSIVEIISEETISFSSNTAKKNGGSIFNTGKSIMTINGEEIEFSFNTVDSAGSVGGAIYNYGSSSMTISAKNITFSSNTAGYFGGVAYNFKNSTMTIIGDNITFNSNNASYGGAFYNDNEAIIEIKGGDIIFSSNGAKNVGGAIYNFKTSTMAITSTGTITFSSNTSGSAGAIYNDSTMIITGEKIEFSSNVANTARTGSGGAIDNNNNAEMIISGRNIIFSSNIAKGDKGGAIYNIGASTMEIISTGTINFSSNGAKNFGGAIFNNKSSNNNSSIITVRGSNIDFKYNTAGIAGGAIYNSGSILNLMSTGKIEFTGNTVNEVSNAIHDDGGTINLYASKNATIIFNDRITSKDSTSVLNINQSIPEINAIGKIVLNENMQGYTGQVNLYAGTVQIGQDGTWFGGNTYIDNATIDMVNSILKEHKFDNLNFNKLTLENNLNLFIEADLANKQMDTITANEDSDIQGKINIKTINILEDATENKTEILFTSSTVLQDKITTIKTASSGLFKYDVNYNDGYFTFSKTGDNPVIAESQVAAAVGGTITQETILNQAFKSIDTHIASIKLAAKMDNLMYASTVKQLFRTSKIERGLWIRPYAMQDTININSLSVDNTAVGTLAGLDLTVGERGILSFYIGYAGSNQKYENIKVTQTGYVVGATGMIIEDDYYLGLTANINYNKAESENNYGIDKFDMNMYALGAKAGYNIELGKNWILEPNLSLMYGNINTQEYKTKQGARIESQSTSNILIEPQIKAKLDLAKGWTPYALVGYVLNAGNKTRLLANNIAFDNMQISGYVEYGLGVNKSFKDSFWSYFLQATGKGGDRAGFEGNIGIKYSF